MHSQCRRGLWRRQVCRGMLHFIGAICIQQQPWATHVASLTIPPAPGDETRTTKIEQSAKLSLGLKRFLLLPQVCSWWEGDTPWGTQSWQGHPIRPDFQSFSRIIWKISHFLCVISHLSHAQLFLLLFQFIKGPLICVGFFPFGVSRTQKFRPS